MCIRDRFKINEPLALQKVVAGLEDLFENDIKDLDMQGDLYEYMLGKLNSAGRLGAFRTPKHIRDMMVKLMMPTPDMKICDPACGTAGFLISSAEYIRSEYGNKMTAEQWEKYGSETFTGFDTDETTVSYTHLDVYKRQVYISASVHSGNTFSHCGNTVSKG